MSIRTTINERLRELGWTRYKLAKAMHPHLSVQGVYQYLSGRNDITGDSLQRMLDALGLTVAPAEPRLVEKPCGDPTKGKKPRKSAAKRARRPRD